MGRLKTQQKGFSFSRGKLKTADKINCTLIHNVDEVKCSKSF